MNQQVSAQSQKLLLQIGRKIRRTLDLDTIWQQTVNSLGQTLGVSRCVICPYQSSSQQVKVAAEYCKEPFVPMLGVDISLASAPHITQALETLKPVVMESFAADDPFERQSVLVVATAYQQQPNGIIKLHRCEGKLSGNDGNADRSWTQAQIEFAEELADQVGSAIALATLYQERSQRTKELSQFKKEFLSTASHELRTPLNHIIGYLQLTVDDMADDPIEERAFIQEAHRSALHLSKVVGNVLDSIQSSKACQAHVELDALRTQQKSLSQ
jgi:GAF domain-containing protein